jgi:Deacetylase PdaC
MKRGILLAAVTAAFFIAGASAKPFKTELKSKWLDLEYSWSSEANAIPALVARFSADMRKQRANLTAQAQKDAADRKKRGFPFNAYQQVTSITTVGETPRLLSLRNDTYEFAGGAHGNSGTKAILWDRRSNKQIDFSALFRTGSGYLTTIRGPYCKALNAERKKRRQGEQLGGEFDQCPPFSQLTLLPADPKPKGRFNQILVVADPYVAGPYVEGSYDIALPLSAALITKLKPEYRPSFGN